LIQINAFVRRRDYFLCRYFDSNRDCVAMSGRAWVRIVFLALLTVIVLLFIRLHIASGQTVTQGSRGNAESGRLSTQAWCTECHSVSPETAGTGKFAPDFTVVAQRRSARWLHSFLRAKHTLMPDFFLNPREADDIVAYIVSLKRR
jgi:mono/diheme cytochrome c family protein